MQNYHYQYVLNRVVVRAAVGRFWKHRFVRARELLLTFVFLSILTILAVIKGRSFWLIATFIGVGVLWFWFVRLRIYFLLLNKMTQQYCFQPVKLVITGKSIAIETPQGKTEKPWSGLNDVLEYRSLILLCWGGFNLLILPLEQLNEVAIAEVKSILENRAQPSSFLNERIPNASRTRIVRRTAILTILLFVGIPIALVTFVFCSINKTANLSFHLHPEPFKVRILAMNVIPDGVSEKIRVTSQDDMKVDVSFGSPAEVGQSVPIRVVGKSSMCDIFLEISRTSDSNILWHSEIDGNILNTEITNAFGTINVITNFPVPFKKGTTIVLAELGMNKILLSVR